MFPQIGDVVGDYWVVGALGFGGMGAVYKVEHIITKRIEAMKVLTSDLTSDPELEQRFVREIQVQARLHHPNIAAVYNAFRAGRQFAMVMEIVEGESLQKVVERGALPLQACMDYARQVLGALAYAHGEGVVHRDVTPGNIIITPDGAAKLTDFGLAIATTDLRLTRTGAPMGSVWYMSPEQVTANSNIDPRTDIYSVGAVLYELLTGRKLFDLDTAFAVMQSHVGLVPPPPSHRNPEIPPALDDIVLKALYKDPAERFQSADEFKLALEQADLSRTPCPVPSRAATLAAAPLPALEPPAGSMALESQKKSPRFSRFDAVIAATLVLTSMGAGLYAVRWFPGVVAHQAALQARPAPLPTPSPATIPPAISEATVAEPAPPAAAPLRTEVETAHNAPRTVRRASQPKPTSQIRVTGGEVDHADLRAGAVSAIVKPQPAPIEAIPSPPAVLAANDHKPPDTEAQASPSAAAETAAASKARKPGNRFLRLLGKIVPFRDGAEHNTATPPKPSTIKE